MKIDNFKPVLVALILMLVGISLIFSPKAVLGQEDGSEAHITIPGDYRIGAGDLLQIVVWKNEEVSGSYRVKPDGKFSMPLIGDIIAEGNTTDGVSMQVEQKLKLFIESPYVSTILQEASSNRIYVLGEVTNPGTYLIDGSLTVLQALSLAGGFTAFAKKENMVLVRGVGEMQKNISLSYSRILRTPGEENNPALKRGDTLVIP